MLQVVEFWTIKDVCKFLRCHPSTVYRLLRQKSLPAFKLGSDWRFCPDKIALWVEQQHASQSDLTDKKIELV